ncbi:hypothetical protein [Kibdelosporangium aridum]|uniref:HEAT repeat domain-containing protein n=1 Tax=Kibdelosporangium aridum TaxID=2030 RepID=A0A1Y5Y178_KIBAR|nr:hypothetical protein [Kibdelosporangium aridum]SMD21131.1 hypothetical protein SAMN05661093_06751 [Kibdelosporangium aridum]
MEEAWQELRKAEIAYIRAGNAILDDENAVEFLRSVFARQNGHHAALRLIGDRAPERAELVLELFPEVFEAALSNSQYAARARYILAGLPPDMRDPRLEALSSREIANPDPERWEELRGLAVLLEQVNRLDILDLLKDAVRDSPSEDLRDIAEYFPEHI